MRLRRQVPSAVLLIAVSCIVLADSPRADHPIIGTWTLTLPILSCSETYRFRSNGMVHTTSGDEVGESIYVISCYPSAKQFYKWVDTITKTNGKRDCAGQMVPVGDQATNFIRFDETGDRIFVCQSESNDSCLGPLRRVSRPSA